MDWQKGKDCEFYEKYPVENRLCVVSTGMNVIVWRKHPWQISSQKSILLQYAREQHFTNPVFFVDDGYSGTNFDRPGFQQMLAEMEAGHVKVCITKDLSRLGRNSSLVGLYTSMTFPKYGVRYIAINDNFDSNDPNSINNDFAGIKTGSMNSTPGIPAARLELFRRQREKRGFRWRPMFPTDT